MSEAIPIDAEGVTRNRQYGPGDHLRHLLRIGYQQDSVIIKQFVQEHNLQSELQNCLKQVTKN